MSAEAEIRRRISARGAITFAEFMEVALYHPDGGYYTSGERIGAGGDFYTSPAVHPAFGALLSVQLFQMWELLGRPTDFTVVETGAGNGLLCRDILTAAKGLDDDFASSLRYVCVDRRTSPGLEGGFNNTYRIASDCTPLRAISGCILSNEMLDAMPVHQVTFRDGKLREFYVAVEGDGLVFTTGEPSSPLLAERFEALGVDLAEGQVAEVNLALDAWAADASRSLERGFVLAIDYGRLAEDLYSPTQRFRGTLTTYHDHLQTDRPLERVGRQDMSTQVDFTSLGRAGAQAGLEVVGYTRQSEFLRNLGLNKLLKRPVEGGSRREVHQSATGMRQLAKPGGLGDFKVMAFGKHTGLPELWGFDCSMQAAALVDRMPITAPTPEHIDLAAGRFPPGGLDFEMSWDALWPDDDSDG